MPGWFSIYLLWFHATKIIMIPEKRSWGGCWRWHICFRYGWHIRNCYAWYICFRCGWYIWNRYARQLHDFSHCGSLLLLARDAARKTQNTSSVLVATIIVVTSFIEYWKSKPTLRREACLVLNFNLKTIFYSAAKITIFHNITKYLLEKNSFFNFFLEIEQIIAIFAPAYCLLWQIVCVINY